MRRPNPAAREGVDDERFRADYIRGCLAQMVGVVVLVIALIAWVANG